MHFTFPARLLILASSILGSVVALPTSPDLNPRQGPNTLSSVYPNDQTGAINLTAWLVPVTKTQASKLAGGRTLLQPSGLPSGYSLGEDQHPLLFLMNYFTDISMYNFTAIKQMSELNLYVPWVQGVASSQKPFSYDANARLASFHPPRGAYKAIGSSSFSLTVDVGLIKNNTDGPELSSPLFISTFQRSSSPMMTVDFLSSTLRQPVIRSGRKSSKETCHKASYRFNET
ncbi:unnamed protein product [Tilletia controversa]|nr:unnamed protein product [Tilletia controversa]